MPLDNSRNPRADGAAESGQLLRFRQLGSLRGPPDSVLGDGTASPGESHVDTSGVGPFPVELSSGDLFGILWRGLADTLGTAAAATLLRRAVQRALPRCPELAALVITRESLEYLYTLPASWRDAVSDRPSGLAKLTAELWPLLIDLTGSVVIQRLEQIPELRAYGILPCNTSPGEEAPR
jgi:hypothetical protein